MRYVAAFMFALLGIVELFVRATMVILFCILTVFLGMFLIASMDKPEQLVTPVCFKLAEKCLGAVWQ